MSNIAPLGDVYQAGTLSGNPIATAAGIAQLQILNNDSAYGALTESAKNLSDGLSEIFKNAGIEAVVPRVGTLLSIFFTKSKPINFDEAHEGLGRFYLHFTDQLIPELPTDDNLRIYKGLDSDVMVMGSVGKNYSAKVYDYSGRLIKEVNFNHKTKINDLDSKMKILRIESEEGLTIKKFKLN